MEGPSRNLVMFRKLSLLFRAVHYNYFLSFLYYHIHRIARPCAANHANKEVKVGKQAKEADSTEESKSKGRSLAEDEVPSAGSKRKSSARDSSFGGLYDQLERIIGSGKG